MKYPVKRERPLGGGQFPNFDQQGPQTKTWNAFPQPCAHTETRTERCPANYPHYAREVCAKCGRFFRWLPRPETVVRQRLNGFRITKLIMHEGLDPWARNFVKSVAQCRKLSLRQQQKLDELVETYLEAKPS